MRDRNWSASPVASFLQLVQVAVMVCDWFSAGRKLELNLPDNSKQSVVLGFSVEKGVDCERVGFQVT